MRDARTAETAAAEAAAEDFDPLRIRPYVSLAGIGGVTEEPGGSPLGPSGASESLRPPEPRRTGPATDPEGPPAPRVRAEPSSSPTVRVPYGVLPYEGSQEPPFGRSPSYGGRSEWSYGQSSHGPSSYGSPGEGGTVPQRRRIALLAASGTVAAVMGAAAFATGLFSYEKPTRDESSPDTGTSAPDAVDLAPTQAPHSASPSHSPSPTASRSSSPTPSKRTSPPPSKRPTPKKQAPRPEPTVRATGSVAPAPSAEPQQPPTLRRGDRGPEVRELQYRLQELRLYTGPLDGVFTSDVEYALTRYQQARGVNEECGVYGPESRRALESETQGY